MAAQRLQTLDVFRGIAILLVIAFHYTARVPLSSVNGEGSLPIVFEFGWIGVFFFFTVSGYCIFYTLEKAQSVGAFFSKRFSRIYPAYFAAVVLLFLYGMVAYIPSVPAVDYRPNPAGFTDMIGNLFFARELGFEWVNGSFWSILVELKFYFWIGILALLATSRGLFIKLFFGLSMLLAGAWFALFLVQPDSRIMELITIVLERILIAKYLPFFALGILGLAIRKGEKSYWPAYLISLFVCCPIIYAESLGNPVISISAFLTLSALFTWFVAGRTLIHIPLVTPALSRVGIISYSFYLLHENLGLSFISTLNNYLPPYGSIIVAILAVYLVSEAFSNLVEWRFRKPVERAVMWLLQLIRLDRFSAFQNNKPAAINS